MLGGYISNTIIPPSDDFALIRVDLNGNLDTTFASGGIFTKDFDGKRDQCFSIKLLPSGKILMGGFTTNSDNSANLTIIRIQ